MRSLNKLVSNPIAATLLVFISFASYSIAQEKPKQFAFNDNTYSFEALRALGLASTGGGEAGEVLTALNSITEGDDESWYTSWTTMADRVAALGDKFAAQGDKVSAQECFFRASQYYRSAEFFIHGDVCDPRINKTWGKSRDTFLKAAKLSKGLIEPIKIPYENTTLSGYYCRADLENIQRPLLIVMTGYDGTAEELYFTNVVAAIKRGFNVLVFDGPGQGAAIHEQNLPFRPDWENVITPIVDFAMKLPTVDTNKIALQGISFGGYLAPRAAAYEHRIAALIANSPIYDWHKEMMANLPEGAEEMLDVAEYQQQFNAAIKATMESDTHIRWAINEGVYKFGAKTPVEYFVMTRPYTNRGLAEKITCPTLFVESADDGTVDGDGKEFFDDLNVPKKIITFSADFGAQYHCQEGNKAIANERILNWLMQTFDML